jgi:hypothetical protein
MSGFTAYTRATTWLYGVLTATPITGVALSGLAVYELDAPEGATQAGDVWVTFEALAPGMDVAEVAAQRIWTEFVFNVLAVTRGRSTKALEAIADEIDNRLHRKAGTTSDGQIIQSTRSEEHDPQPWLDQGVEYRGLGGQYHLIVQPL